MPKPCGSLETINLKAQNKHERLALKDFTRKGKVIIKMLAFDPVSTMDLHF